MSPARGVNAARAGIIVCYLKTVRVTVMVTVMVEGYLFQTVTVTAYLFQTVMVTVTGYLF